MNNELKNQEKNLLTNWKHQQNYSHFIKDGIFDHEQWDKEKIKITFVLKEANWVNGDCDLREWIMSEESSTYWKTWNNIARWSKAILEGGDYPKYVSRADKTYWLKKVSFLNLKKVGGTQRADDNIIREYAIKDSKFINEQLSLYKPDIIICCGRGNGKNADLLYEEVLEKSLLTKWQEPINGFNYFFTQFDGNANKTPVISFYHPQRIAGHDLFEKWYCHMLEFRDYFFEAQITTK